MSQLRDQMMVDLRLAGYVERTRSNYVGCIGELAKYYWGCPGQLDRDQLRGWIQHLAERRKLSVSRRRQHFAALRFFYGRTLGKPELVSFLSLRRGPEKLPIVLSRNEVQRVLDALRLTKYRVLFTTVYATGLRINEACRLEIGDIDAQRGVLHVRHGKGGKERIVPLSEQLLEILRAYWQQERPPAPFLFASNRGNQLSVRTAQRAIKHAAQQAGIDKKVTPHVLRHSFATHLLESGVEIRVIQVLLGHARLESTTRYARVSTRMIAKTPSPLDQLPPTD